MAKKVAQAEGVNFGSKTFYGGGGRLPEGNYALEFMVQMHQATNPDGSAKGPARLGIMLHAHPLDGGEVREQFLGMGRNADKSFAPNAQGKGLVPVPGGPSTSLPGSTNWGIFRDSLENCDPAVADIFTNDISVLDGIHVHIQNVPEPEERKSFAQNNTTGDVANANQPRQPGFVPVVTEILEGGKPWEGGGGLPEAEEAKPAAKAGAKPAAKAPVKAATKPAAKAAPVEEAADEETIKTAAITGIDAYLSANVKGGPKVLLKTAALKKMKADFGDEIAQQAMETFIADDEQLAALLDEMEYAIAGPTVKPKA